VRALKISPDFADRSKTWRWSCPPKAGPPQAGKTVMAITYILFSKTINKFYVGSSRDEELTSRLNSHNQGKVKSTKHGRPWLVITIEHLNNYTDARKRENFLKSGIGRKWIKENFSTLKNKSS